MLGGQGMWWTTSNAVIILVTAVDRRTGTWTVKREPLPILDDVTAGRGALLHVGGTLRRAQAERSRAHPGV